MNRENKWMLVFAGLSLILMIVSIVMLFRGDRKPPEIRFSESQLIYSQKTDASQLLEGVSAWDERDGDVTDRLVIEKISFSSDGQFVSVAYAASDSSGNFSKTTKIFEMEEYKNNAMEGKTEAPLKEREPGRTDPEEDGEPESKESQKEEEQQQEEIPEENDLENPEEEPEAEVPEAPPDEAPVLELNTGEATLKVGEAFDWANYIGSVSDDKDSVEMLYGNLHMSGMLDMQTPGDYTLSIHVRDSGGNASQEQSMVIHVVE